MDRAALILPLALALVTGCDEPSRSPIASSIRAVGEPMNGYPDPEERLLHALTNRARAAPGQIHGCCSTFYNPGPLPPLGWDYDLNRSSRFQSTHLTLADCTLMHPSCCTLNTNVGTSGCNGDPSCACAGPINCPMCGTPPSTGCGTDPFVRVGYFYKPAAGGYANAENGAAGYADPWSAFQGWIDECPPNDGHRTDILNNTSNQLGNGAAHAGAGAACWSSFYFQDFGYDPSYTVPELPAGAVNPVAGGAGSYDFYLNYWHPTGPRSAQVVIDGTCSAMALEMGGPTNGTYKATVALSAGCHQYWFLVTDGDGTRVTYPTIGALTVAAGGTCAAAYVTGATPAACESTTRPDMGIQPIDAPPATRPDAPVTGATDASFVSLERVGGALDGTPIGGADGGDADGGIGGEGGKGGEGGAAIPQLQGGCGCALGGAPAGSASSILLVLLGLVLSRRRGSLHCSR